MSVTEPSPTTRIKVDAMSIEALLLPTPDSWTFVEPKKAAIICSFGLEAVIERAKECAFSSADVHAIFILLMKNHRVHPLHYVKAWSFMAGRALMTVYPGVFTAAFFLFMFQLALDRNDTDSIPWLFEKATEIGYQRSDTLFGLSPSMRVSSLEMFNTIFPTRESLSSGFAYHIAVQSRIAAIPERLLAEEVTFTIDRKNWCMLVPCTVPGLKLYMAFNPSTCKTEFFIDMLTRRMNPELVSMVASPDNVKASTFFKAAHLGCPLVVEALLEKAGSVLTKEERKRLTECMEACTPGRAVDVPFTCPACCEEGEYTAVHALAHRKRDTL